jgi:hypothetical protein
VPQLKVTVGCRLIQTFPNKIQFSTFSDAANGFPILPVAVSFFSKRLVF